MSSLNSSYDGATIDSDGDIRCKCGFDMRLSTVRNMKSPHYSKNYFACKRLRKDTQRCGVFIWHEELSKVKTLLPRFSDPMTPKTLRTLDIRHFGIVTPSSSFKRPSMEDEVDVDINIATRHKRPITPPPSGNHKRARVLRTPEPETEPEESGAGTVGGSHSGRSRRWEDYQRGLLETPSKCRDYRRTRGYDEQVEEEDYMSDWDDGIIEEMIRIADGLQPFNS